MKKILNWFLSLFKKKEKVVTDKPINDSYEEKKETDKYRRIAIIVGHTKSSKGASSYSVNGKVYREYDWNKDRANEIRDMLEKLNPQKDIKIFYRDGIGRAGVAKMVNRWNANISLELHFDSIGHNKNAYGSKILVLKNDDKSAKIAHQLIQTIYKQFKTKTRGVYISKSSELLRGVIGLTLSDRGFNNLNYINKDITRLLIEPFYGGTETEESRRFLLDPEKYSRVISAFLSNLK